MKSTKNLPIGYWVKQSDEFLTKGIDAIQSSFGITRTDWQLLNLINEQKTFVVLLEIMMPFADEQTIRGIITKLQNEGLIEESEPHYRLTNKGQELYTLCFDKQKAFRQHAIAGIPEHDYTITVQTLQRLIQNVSVELR